MPLATLHLISLAEDTSLLSFLDHLTTTPLKPLVISKVIRWIISPELIDVNALLHPSKPWDILLILPSTDPLPPTLLSKISSHWTTTVGIPSRLTNTFSETNTQLLHPDPNTIPPLSNALSNPITRPSSQTLSLSPDLQTWISTFSHTSPGRQAVSMLNLLSFHPTLKPSYLTHGQAFASSIGSKRGGNAKLVGNIINNLNNPDPNTTTITSPTPTAHPLPAPEEKVAEWDEFALAHYPSILHFADMLASADYQEINMKYRVPSLKDTCILCTSEIAIEELYGGGKAKL